MNNTLTPARPGKKVTAFLAFKRALGHRYRRGEFTLRNFERFAAGAHEARSPTIVGSQPVDLGVIVIAVLAGSQLLPKQMLYQAELHPDRPPS
jgi:hypothetical protein